MYVGFMSSGVGAVLIVDHIHQVERFNVFIALSEKNWKLGFNGGVLP
jgi:hypothetical protein